MIERLLPPAVAAAETFDADVDDAALFPAERRLIARAVPKRRREFTAARMAAHRAMVGLGVAPTPVLTGHRGAPQWPAGIVGSITHCAGYAAAALARTTDVAALGIDAERHAALPHEILDDVTRPEERGPLADLAAATPGVHWDRLLFCAKECVYKAWFPLMRQWLGFQDATVDLRPDGTFGWRLHVARVPAPLASPSRGRWAVRDGLVLAAIAVPA